MSEKQEKPILKKWWFWVIAIFVIGGLLGAAIQNSENKTGNDNEQSTIQDTPNDKLSDLHEGNSVTIYGVTITVNSIKIGKPALAGTTPTYDVNVTYKNHSGSSITISPYDWTTVLKSGSDKAHVGGDASFSLATLEDKEEWTGNVNLWADGEPEKVKFESSTLNLAKNDKKRATWLIVKD